MGLAPSENPENLGKSVVAKVPVPIFSQPLRVPSAVYGTRRGCKKMGLAPSRNGENPGKSAVAKVPVLACSVCGISVRVCVLTYAGFCSVGAAGF
jgi:hypothetical protein